MSTHSAVSRVQRVRHDTKRRELRVARVEAISPHFLAVTFTGDALADFISASFDDHVKFIIDNDGPEPVWRDYTPRRYDRDARELTIEFALHGDGPAAAWAERARPGDSAIVAGPRGSFVIPVDFDWHLLVGDDTALPAIARRLEELPASTRAVVRVHAAQSDRRTLSSAAGVDIQWVDSAAALIESVRSLALPTGEGYAWCAGEASTMAAIRKVLVDDKGHDRHAIRAAAYWKQGSVAHHKNLDE